MWVVEIVERIARVLYLVVFVVTLCGCKCNYKYEVGLQCGFAVWLAGVRDI